jgi:hypothetical protein
MVSGVRCGFLPSIDRYGWVQAALSERTISAVMARARTGRTRLAEPLWSRPLLTGRYAEASSAQLAAAYDAVDERAAALLERIQAVLDDGRELGGEVSRLRAERPSVPLTSGTYSR